MRTVLANREIPHLWAHQTQERASNDTGSFYFEGDTIYSYGSHFPIARHVKHNGLRAVFFTTRGYSNTTSQHKSYARSSIPSTATVFYVENPRLSVHEAFRWHKERVKEAAAALDKPMKINQRSAAHGDLETKIDALNAFAKFWGYKLRVKVPAPGKAIQEYRRKRQEAQNERDRKRAEKREKEAAARRLAEEAFQRDKEGLCEQWRNGENCLGKYAYRLPTLLRLKGDDIETSRGASFPLDHARRVLPLIKRLLESGTAWHRNGQEIRLGHYYLDSISADGTITAGCHVVPKEEVLRLIRLLEQRADANLQEMAFAGQWK